MSGEAVPPSDLDQLREEYLEAWAEEEDAASRAAAAASALADMGYLAEDGAVEPAEDGDSSPNPPNT